MVAALARRGFPPSLFAALLCVSEECRAHSVSGSFVLFGQLDAEELAALVVDL